jgi:hypothetical protein
VDVIADRRGSAIPAAGLELPEHAACVDQLGLEALSAEPRQTASPGPIRLAPSSFWLVPFDIDITTVFDRHHDRLAVGGLRTVADGCRPTAIAGRRGGKPRAG